MTAHPSRWKHYKGKMGRCMTQMERNAPHLSRSKKRAVCYGKTRRGRSYY